MAQQVLDALALAGLSPKAQIGRIAALWREELQSYEPTNRAEVEKWVKKNYGPVFNPDQRASLSAELLLEIKRQIRLRRERNKRELLVDPAGLPVGDPLRMSRLVYNRLGPARRWISGYRAQDEQVDWIDTDFHSGLVSGLVPIRMRVGRINDPNLLVYRYRWEPVMTRFVPTYITTVEDAFIWLVPPDVAEFLRLEGSRVEHDGESQTLRLITQFGEKTLPWRDLAST